MNKKVKVLGGMLSLMLSHLSATTVVLKNSKPYTALMYNTLASDLHSWNPLKLARLACIRPTAENYALLKKEAWANQDIKMVQHLERVGPQGSFEGVRAPLALLWRNKLFIGLYMHALYITNLHFNYKKVLQTNQQVIQDLHALAYGQPMGAPSPNIQGF